MNRLINTAYVMGFIVCALLTAGCIADAIYHPVRTIRCTPADAELMYEDVSIVTADNVKISGWWIPALPSHGTVLFCHGNAGNISDRLDTIVIINSLGLDTFIFDYRGYGSSNGSPSEGGTYEDAGAAWNYLVNQRGITPGRIIIWGRSLGGAVAARTASLHRPWLVIIESAFTSVSDLAKELCWWLPSFFLADYAYDTRLYIRDVTAPVLVIHSTDDEVIPFHHGEKLYESIPGEKALLQIRGSHNRGFLDSRALYAEIIGGFIEKYSDGRETMVP